MTTLSLSTAAAAAGLSPKTIRNWLDRGLVHLDASDDRGERAWTRFGPVEMARLAFVGRASGFGVGVTEADRIFETAFRQALALAKAQPDRIGARFWLHLPETLTLAPAAKGGFRIISGREAGQAPACLVLRPRDIAKAAWPEAKLDVSLAEIDAEMDAVMRGALDGSMTPAEADAAVKAGRRGLKARTAELKARMLRR